MDKKLFTGGFYKIEYDNILEETIIRFYCFNTKKYAAVYISNLKKKKEDVNYGLEYAQNILLDRTTYIGLRNLIDISKSLLKDPKLKNIINKYLENMGYIQVISDADLADKIKYLKELNIKNPILLDLIDIHEQDGFHEKYEKLSSVDKNAIRVIVDRSAFDVKSMEMKNEDAIFRCYGLNLYANPSLIKTLDHTETTYLYMYKITVRLFKNTK